MTRGRNFMTLALCLATVSALALAIPATAAAPHLPRFDLGSRIAAQRAIEGVYWSHRDWPTQNRSAKPSVDEVASPSVLRDKVESALRLTNALQAFWHDSVSGADLQAEMDREARDTRQPQMLRELWAALDNDPALIAETLARTILVDLSLIHI